MGGTLIKPPPPDPDKSLIENVLEVVELGQGSNIFTNRREAWHPPGARGIFGGAMIAMCLASAQKTVPDDFTVHSLHCYFLLAGSSELPILFHVENVRDGRSFATRTVQARQSSKCIFTTTMSFVRSGAGGPPEQQVRHALPMPAGLEQPPPDSWEDPFSRADDANTNGPIESYRVEMAGQREGAAPHAKRSRVWVRARGPIAGPGHQPHLNALAYMSDSWFIGTVARIHGLWRIDMSVEDFEGLDPDVQAYVRRLSDWDGLSDDVEDLKTRRRVGMMVSLDHVIYFHEPRRFRADEWLFSEMDSPWSGDGRGVVHQRIYTRDGLLVATCVQEGVVRLKKEDKKREQESKL